MLFFIGDTNFHLKIFLLLNFIIGLISDTNFLSNPNIRFFLQFTLVFYFVFSLDLRIFGIGLDFIDYYLSNKYVNYSFSIFCILILVNGFNFIDGLNTLALGYFLIVICSLMFVENKYFYDFKYSKIMGQYYFCFFVFITIKRKFISWRLWILYFRIVFGCKNNFYKKHIQKYQHGILLYCFGTQLLKYYFL